MSIDAVLLHDSVSTPMDMALNPEFFPHLKTVAPFRVGFDYKQLQVRPDHLRAYYLHFVFSVCTTDPRISTASEEKIDEIVNGLFENTDFSTDELEIGHLAMYALGRREDGMAFVFVAHSHDNSVEQLNPLTYNNGL